MAVIIRGMDKPKECISCPFNMAGICIAQQRGNTKILNGLEVTNWCPLEAEKHGEWIEDEDGDGRHCSVCGEDFCYLVSDCEKYKFCPTCGAKLL